MNLRQAADCCLPAANVVSMVFLDRKPPQIADPGRLLHSIHDGNGLDPPPPVGSNFHIVAFGPAFAAGRTGEAGRSGTLRSDLRSVQFGQGHGRFAPAAARREDRSWQRGPGRHRFFAPVRDGTAVAVALVLYAGELQICMQYDSRRITEAQAADLMATYLQKIRTSLRKTE